METSPTAAWRAAGASGSASQVPADVADAPVEQEASDFVADFGKRSRRTEFITKVYGILALQLLTTAAVVWYLASQGDIEHFLHRMGIRTPWTLLIPPSAGLVLAMCLSLTRIRFWAPYNYILLAAFTAMESLTVGFACMLYEPESVLLAFYQAGIALLSLTMYAFHSDPRYDFTEMEQTLFSFLWALLVGSFTNLLVLNYDWVDFGLSVGGAFLFSAFIVHDTRRIMRKGGKRKLNSAEYIAASMVLYLDALNLFLDLLRIFGKKKGRKASKSRKR